MLMLDEGEYAGEIDAHLSVDGALLSVTRYTSGEPAGHWHCHANPHASFIIQDDGRCATRPQRDFFFYRAGQSHRWEPCGQTSTSLNLEIGPEFLTRHGIEEAVAERSLEAHVGTRTRLLQLLCELQSDPLERPTAVRTLLLELVNASRRTPHSRRPRWAQTLATLLHDSWSEPVSLEDLSAQVDAHPVTISRAFRTHFGCSFGAYRRMLKIERSIPLIKDTRRSFADIAATCGFADQSHFGRTFRQLTGFRPREFRAL